MIFISHSSRDHEAAAALHAKLIARAYDPSQLFLDSDVDSGIAAGEPWQQILYTRLKDCRALIVLCTQAWLDSKWCFAELVYAKANGKEIFPVILEPCDFRGVLDEHQAVFVHRDGDAAYERLWRALDSRHLGPRDDFGWPPADGDVCPFPGLMSFDERHAGVYFGREPETQNVLEELRKMRANGEPRLLMITGGSGSGKSSLLKAGVLPQLKHKSSDAEWLVLPVLRYGEAASPQHTVIDQLAMNVAGAKWKSLRDAFTAKAFVDAALDLAVARGSTNATVVLPIDQFEELLAPAAGPDANAFLEFLREVFGCANGRLLSIGTMRSDHLDVYERHPSALAAPYFHSWRLGPFPRDRVRDVIMKPAARAHVEVAPELLDRLERDTPTSESLPLLAFTLEKLYRRSAGDGRLDLHEYEGMERAIERSAEAAAPPSLPADVLSAVRLTFVKYLASVNDKDEVVRTIAHWSDVPDAAKPVLERFVAERLLTKSEHGIEVAHEALFRAWPTLRKWLADAADILRWRRDVQRDRASDAKWTLLRPAQLAVAKPWLRTRRNELTDDEAGWIRRSVRRERAKRAFAALIAVVIVVFAGYAYWQKGLADQASESSLGKYLASQSAEIANTQARNSDLSLILAIEAYRRDPSDIAALRLRSAMAETPVPVAQLEHRGPVNDVAFSPDGRLLATVENQEVRVWDFARRTVVASMKGKDLHGISWSRDGAQLAVESSIDRILLWDWRTKRAPVVTTPRDGERLLQTERWLWPGTTVPIALDFGTTSAYAGISSGQHTAFAVHGEDRTVVRVTDATGREVALPYVMPGDERVSVLAFRPDGQALAIASDEGWTRIWDWQSNQILATHQGYVKPITMVFSPDGGLLAELGFVEWLPAMRVWHTSTGSDLYRFDGGERVAPSEPMASFTADGRQLVVSMGDEALRSFFIAPNNGHVAPVLRFATGSPMYATDVDRTGTFAAAATEKLVTVWRLQAGHAVQHFADLYDVVAAPRGSVVALIGRESELLDTASRTTLMKLGHVSIGSGVFSNDGQQFAYVSGDQIAIADLRSKSTHAVSQRGAVNRMRFASDGKRLLVAEFQSRLAAIDLPRGEKTDLMPARVSAYATFSPDGRFFVDQDDSRIRLYDVTLRKRMGEIPTDAFSGESSFNANGTLFFGYESETTVGVWSAELEQVLRVQLDRTQPPVLFDPSGRYLAVGNEAAIQIFDTIERREVRQLAQRGGAIHSMAYTADGEHLAAFTADKNVRIWRMVDGQPVMVIPQAQSYGPGMPSIIFTPDGKYLVVPQEGGARLVVWQRDDVLREACRRALRKKLDREEWEQFLPGQKYRETCSFE